MRQPLSKNELKLFSSLRQKKYRYKNLLFLAEGVKIVSEILESHYRVQHLIATKEYADRFCGKNEIPCSIASPAQMKTLSQLSTPPGIIAVVSIPELHFDESKLGKTTLVLDNLTDPGNLGTIIRTADWFGIQNILCSPGTVDLYNPKTIQATMGSFTRVNIYQLPLEKALKQLQNRFIVLALDMHGTPIHQIEPNKPKLIITGSESAGISPELKHLIDKYISIPSHYNQRNNGPESLNASIATAIACYILTED